MYRMKLLTILLCLLLVLTAVSCADKKDDAVPPQKEEQESGSDVPEKEDVPSAPEVDVITSATFDIDNVPSYKGGKDSTVLVAYFSTDDTPRAAAVLIADTLNADIFEIIPVEPYTEADIDYRTSGYRAGQEQKTGARPAIVSMPDDISGYDTVIIVYPIWSGQSPAVMYTFLENAGIKDAEIIPVCTSNSSSAGSSAKNMEGLTDPSVTWREAYRIPKGSTEDDIREWAGSILQKEKLIMKLFINGKEISVEWEDNASVDELSAIVKDAPLTVGMSMYGGFEQVGSLDRRLPSSDRRIATSPGDIVLYNSDKIVIFYGSNTWEYTRLGKISGLSAEQLSDLLGNGDVTVVIS